MVRLAASIALVLLAGSCASAVRPPASVSAAYRAPARQIWLTVIEELRRDFPGLLSDGTDGHVTTCWLVVDKHRGALSDGGERGWKLWRVEATLSRTLPFRVTLHGVGADYTPGGRFVTPIAAGDPAEPHWLAPRTRAIADRIDARLAHTSLPGTPAPPPAPVTPPAETLDSACIFDAALRHTFAR